MTAAIEAATPDSFEQGGFGGHSAPASLLGPKPVTRLAIKASLPHRDDSEPAIQVIARHLSGKSSAETAFRTL
jgi:hypothetical protein